MPDKVAQKCNLVHDFANNAGRWSKTYQASRGVSAIAELRVPNRLRNSRQSKGTRLSWFDGKDEQDAEVENDASQWNKVVVAFGRHGDIDYDEDG